MAQANVIAKVSSLTGEAFARDASGNLRRLQSGDVIREGETGGLFPMGDVAAQMGSEAYGRGQDTFARTLALAPSTIQSFGQGAQMQSAVGAQRGLAVDLFNAALPAALPAAVPVGP